MPDHTDTSRRRFLQHLAGPLAVASLIGDGRGLRDCRAGDDADNAAADRTPAEGRSPEQESAEWRPIFDGRSLEGWHTNRERIGHGSGGAWRVVDGGIVGGQDPPGNGGLLLSDALYGDFELTCEIKPDWYVDSGLFVRSTPRGEAFQIAIDHCPGGYVGQIYGEGLGGWNTRTLAIAGQYDEETGRLTQLDTVARALPEGTTLPHAISADEWKKAWKMNEWNTLRVRVVGQLPRITTWLNGVMVVDFDAARYQHPRYDLATLKNTAPRTGHIALQVHGGTTRWREGAVSRWRNLRVRDV